MKEMKTLKLPGQKEAYEIVDAYARGRLDTDTFYTHPTYTAFTSSPTENMTPAFGTNFPVPQIITDDTGHVTTINNRMIRIPSSTAKTDKAGLMSAADKTQLYYGGIPIVTTEGTGAAYTATIDGFMPKVGSVITIIPHTTSTTVTPTLNVNNTTAFNIKLYNSNATSTGTSPMIPGLIRANYSVTLQFTGDCWMIMNFSYPNLAYTTGTLPITKGGTGATTADAALTNLGAAAKTHTHEQSEINGLADALAAAVPTSEIYGSSSGGGSTTGASISWQGEGVRIGNMVQLRLAMTVAVSTANTYFDIPFTYVSRLGIPVPYIKNNKLHFPVLRQNAWEAVKGTVSLASDGTFTFCSGNDGFPTGTYYYEAIINYLTEDPTNLIT